MTENQVTQRHVEAFGRFLKLLPHGKDLTLVILKGHLLIEEQVWQIIDERVGKPDALRKNVKFDCHQAICIAEALCPQEQEPWLWEAVKKLNKIRNEIAHKTEPVGIEDRVDDFVNSVASGLYFSEDKQGRFEGALWSLFEAVSSLVERPTATVLELVKGKDEVT